MKRSKPSAKDRISQGRQRILMIFKSSGKKKILFSVDRICLMIHGRWLIGQEGGSETRFRTESENWNKSESEWLQLMMNLEERFWILLASLHRHVFLLCSKLSQSQTPGLIEREESACVLCTLVEVFTVSRMSIKFVSCVLNNVCVWSGMCNPFSSFKPAICRLLSQLLVTVSMILGTYSCKERYIRKIEFFLAVYSLYIFEMECK